VASIWRVLGSSFTKEMGSKGHEMQAYQPVGVQLSEFQGRFTTLLTRVCCIAECLDTAVAN